MQIKTVFKRREMKYRITISQKERILAAIKENIRPDEFGNTVIRNIYFDTDTYLLIRRSIEKPCYKEKLRLRSYCKLGKGDKAFFELKKKYKSIVYKRRLTLTTAQAENLMNGKDDWADSSQIAREILYFMEYYKCLKPKLFLSYEREAFYSVDGSDLRITFDSNILCREEGLSLSAEAYGVRLIPEDEVIMEVKGSGGMPFWLLDVLSKEKIYKTSFSKYGEAYKNIIFPKIRASVLKQSLGG